MKLKSYAKWARLLLCQATFAAAGLSGLSLFWITFRYTASTIGMWQGPLVVATFLAIALILAYEAFFVKGKPYLDKEQEEFSH